MKPPSYDEMRRHIERRYNRIFWLIFHLTLAVVSAELLRASDPTPQNGNPRITIPWFGLILVHAVKVGMDILKDREIERTWQHYYGADEVVIIDKEKPKRLARLMDESEDDELTHEHNGQAHHQDQERRQKGS